MLCVIIYYAVVICYYDDKSYDDKWFNILFEILQKKIE